MSLSVPLPPVWMAAPPEVHSTLLNIGGTPGPIAAAGASWTTVGAEYLAALAELEGIIASVQANYSGPSAEQFVASQQPLLAWLTTVALKSTTASAAHAEIVSAYTASVLAMPTMPELITNHTTHGVLNATNFLGVNTVPIAVNEADYVRMWITAANTMQGWDATSTLAVDTIPPTPLAPMVLMPGVGESGNAAATTMQLAGLTEGTAAGTMLAGSDVISTKLLVGKAATSPLSGVKAAGNSENPLGDIDEQLKPEMMTGVVQQIGSMAPSAAQAATSGLQGGPQQLLSSAPQMLSSAPQMLGQALGGFGGQEGGNGIGAVPVGFPGTAAVRGINPAGLTSLASAGYGSSAPARPLMPSSWGTSAAPETPAANARTPLAAMSGAGMGGAGGMMGAGAAGRRSNTSRAVTTYADTPEMEAATADEERRRTL